MTKRYCVDHLKEKTDAECRELAKHYYRRARTAEAQLRNLQQEAEQLRLQLNFLMDKQLEVLEAVKVTRKLIGGGK